METLAASRFSSSPHRFGFLQGHYESENPSAASTPFVSAPSSPGRNGTTGFYFSAPPSPTWATRIEARDAAYMSYLGAVVPLSWVEKPGTPKSASGAGELEDRSSRSLAGSDFEFSARFVEFEEPPMSPTPMSSANELFLKAQIRPLRPPPRLQNPAFSGKQPMAADGTLYDPRICVSCPVSPPQSPRSLKNGQRSATKGSKCKMSDPDQEVFDPFAVAMEEMRKNDALNRHRQTRSSSPLRILNCEQLVPKFSEREGQEECRESPNDVGKKVRKGSFPKSSRKWTLKDLLGSSRGEGRAESKEGSQSWPESSSQQSCRGSRRSESSQSSTEWERDRSKAATTRGGNASSATKKSAKGSVSPHELHYTKQRAQAEELKRRTFLPYRHGLLGCLRFSWKSYGAMANISSALKPVS